MLGTKTDAYFLMNMRLAIAPAAHGFGQVGRMSDHLQLSLTIRNLLDTDYAKPGGLEHLQPAIPQDGRNYLLRLDYRL